MYGFFAHRNTYSLKFTPLEFETLQALAGRILSP